MTTSPNDPADMDTDELDMLGGTDEESAGGPSAPFPPD